MAEPLAIIGAIAACQQIISRLTQVIKALSIADKEQDSIVLRLNHQAILLRGFSKLLTESRSEFDAYQHNHFDVVINHMKIILDNMQVKMEKVSKRKSSKFLWALAGNDLKDAERELFEWSQRLMIGFSFMSTPVKTNFVEMFSDLKNTDSLPLWLSALMANIRMERGKNDVAFVSTDPSTVKRLDEPTPWNTLHPESLKQLWVDQVKTNPAIRGEAMTMDEIKLEVARLFTVLKQADSVSNRILRAEHFLVTDNPQHRFAIASSLPGDTCQKQLLSEMLVEPSEHVSASRVKPQLITC